MRRNDITTFFGYGTALMTEEFTSTTEMGKRMFFFSVVARPVLWPM